MVTLPTMRWQEMTINKNEYLISPCKVASIPYWKAKSITLQIQRQCIASAGLLVLMFGMF